MKLFDLDWPAQAYIYGTFGYALKETIIRAKKHNQKMFLYKGVLDEESVWISSWDPKRSLKEDDAVVECDDETCDFVAVGKEGLDASMKHIHENPHSVTWRMTI